MQPLFGHYPQRFHSGDGVVPALLDALQIEERRESMPRQKLDLYMHDGTTLFTTAGARSCPSGLPRATLVPA